MGGQSLTHYLLQDPTFNYDLVNNAWPDSTSLKVIVLEPSMEKFSKSGAWYEVDNGDKTLAISHFILFLFSYELRIDW